MQLKFPLQFRSKTVEQFVAAINKVQPSLIRTEADEVTYHFHIMIRYEIEKLLIDGTLSAKEIPGFWSEYYQKYLGIKVPDDLSGCMQDVHWSHGSFGYFATYSIGSLYAAQFYECIKHTHAGIENNIANGNNLSVTQWLQNNVYKHGRYFNSEELCENATGECLNSKYFLNYVTHKYLKN